MEANLYGVVADTSPDPGAYVAEWEKMPVADVDALWEAPKGDKVNAKPPNDIVCTVHGIICKKGICVERARLVREKERAEKLEKDRAAGRGGRGGGRNKAGGGGRGKNGGNYSNGNGNRWDKKAGGANPWNQDDDSGSATGSEGRSGARSPAKNDGWATVRR
ncbi:hypothetical protein B0H12DRAFT_746842 [Mycena haematopus]|nr:hypothetical protein B0H12DRAFT_746842 [Mycena haematopus]